MSSGAKMSWKCGHGDMESEYMPVAEFYADKSVFITGGTGFLGKVLVEKLLRSCPKLKNIYLLIRPKRGQDMASRLSELTQAPLFDKLKKERPQELNKIMPIMGDIAEPDMGISIADQAILCQKVSVVFHSAATVKFDEKLKVSVTINMLGTKQLVQLCHRMIGLEVLVYVSTAYCNCDKERIEECVYVQPAKPEHVIALVQTLPDDLIDRITPALLGDKPNTYTFTKALTEDLLIKECKNLPLAIVRPSIVLSSAKEPVEGWLDNWNGPSGLVVAASKGIIRTMVVTKHQVADFVPVDTVTNLMIASAWRMHNNRGDSVVVYNCCTGQQNPITWQQFLNIARKCVMKNPLSEMFWYPGGDLTTSKLKNSILSTFQHRIPAFTIDFIATLIGKKPKMVKLQGRLEKAVACFEYFSARQWSFPDDNVQTLCCSLSAEDRITFDFNVRNINWNTYVESYILGIRKFLVKENPDTLLQSRKLLFRLYILHTMTQVTAVILVWRIIFFRFKPAQNLWRIVLELFKHTTRFVPL